MAVTVDWQMTRLKCRRGRNPEEESSSGAVAAIVAAVCLGRTIVRSGSWRQVVLCGEVRKRTANSNAGKQASGLTSINTGRGR